MATLESVQSTLLKEFTTLKGMSIPHLDFLDKLGSNTAECRKFLAEIERKILCTEFNIGVNGPFSSGKSTLIMLIIKRLLLPEALAAETMLDLRIENDPTLKGDIQLYDNGALMSVRTDAEVCDWLRTLNHEIREKAKVTPIPILVKEHRERAITLKMNIEVFAQKNGLRIVINDNGGDGEQSSSKEDIKKFQYEQIALMDTILFVLEAQSIQSVIVIDLLIEILKRRPDFFGTNSHRILFVINKLDLAIQAARGKSVDQVKSDLVSLLRQMIKTHVGVDIPESQIVCISAEEALIGTMGKLNPVPQGIIDRTLAKAPYMDVSPQSQDLPRAVDVALQRSNYPRFLSALMERLGATAEKDWATAVHADMDRLRDMQVKLATEAENKLNGAIITDTGAITAVTSSLTTTVAALVAAVRKRLPHNAQTVVNTLGVSGGNIQTISAELLKFAQIGSLREDKGTPVTRGNAIAAALMVLANNELSNAVTVFNKLISTAASGVASDFASCVVNLFQLTGQGPAPVIPIIGQLGAVSQASTPSAIVKHSHKTTEKTGTKAQGGIGGFFGGEKDVYGDFNHYTIDAVDIITKCNTEMARAVTDTQTSCDKAVVTYSIAVEGVFTNAVQAHAAGYIATVNARITASRASLATVNAHKVNLTALKV